MGYMGSGKSAIGKRLAEKLNLSFIDLDDYIEKHERRTISEIFSAEGEDKFRAIEHKQLKTILDKKNAVVSLGGGTPCFHDNISLINKNGKSFYLEVSVDDLSKRLNKAKNKRPLIEGMNEIDLQYFIEANLEKRIPFYKRANYTIPIGMQGIEEVAEKILSFICKS